MLHYHGNVYSATGDGVGDFGQLQPLAGTGAVAKRSSRSRVDRLSTPAAEVGREANLAVLRLCGVHQLADSLQDFQHRSIVSLQFALELVAP